MPIFGGALRPYKSSPRMTPNPIGGQSMGGPMNNNIGPSSNAMSGMIGKMGMPRQLPMQQMPQMMPQIQSQMGGNMNFWNPWSGQVQGQGQDMYNPTTNPGGKNLSSGGSGMTNMDNITNPWLRSRIQTMR